MKDEIKARESDATPTNDMSSNHYPLLDAAIESGNPSVLARIERTCKEIDRLVQTGTPREKERAGAALLAYRRALDMYQHLATLRDEALSNASNMRSGMPITE